MAQRAVRPKAFPVSLPTGPQQESLEHNWSWQTNSLPQAFAHSYCEWLVRMEDDMCRLHGLEGREAAKHRGRAKGPVFETVPMEKLEKTNSIEFRSPAAIAWASLAAWFNKTLVCAKLAFFNPAGASQNWRNLKRLRRGCPDLSSILTVKDGKQLLVFRRSPYALATKDMNGTG